MSAQVLSFPNDTTASFSAPVLRDKVPARWAFVANQTNAENSDDEEDTHKRNHGLLEKINHVDGQMIPLAQEAAKRREEWKRHDEQAHDVPFAPKVVVRLFLVFTVVGELVLSATAFQGLGKQDWEAYVLAFSLVAAALGACKVIANTLRWLPTRLKEKPLVYFEIATMTLAVIGLFIFVWGMNEARLGYSVARKAAGEDGLSETSRVGQTVLQAAMFALQVAIFYGLAGANVIAERARANYQAAHKKLIALHAERLKFAARLNEQILRYQARHAARVHRASQLMADWLCDMHVKGKGGWFAAGSGIETEIRADWFEGVHPRLCQPIDAAPMLVQEVLQGGGAGGKASAKFNQPYNLNHPATQTPSSTLEK